jgi:hypothetical protein
LLLAEVACSDPQTGFWFFDSNTQMLCRMNRQRTIDLRSMNLSQELAGDAPTGLSYSNNQLFLWTSSGNLLLFDHYANYLKLERLNVAGNLYADDHYYYFASAKGWVRFDILANGPEILSKNIPPDGLKLFGSKHHLVIITKQGAYLYKNYFNEN